MSKPLTEHLNDIQEVSAIDSLNYGASVLFQHTFYKSYPMPFMEKGRFNVLRYADNCCNGNSPISAKPGAQQKAHGIGMEDLRSTAWLSLLKENLDRLFTD